MVTAVSVGIPFATGVDEEEVEGLDEKEVAGRDSRTGAGMSKMEGQGDAAPVTSMTAE